MIDKLKELCKQYKDARFLKKHGCETWREYNRRYDPDFFSRARYVKNAYRGYKFITKLPDEYYGLREYSMKNIEKWCEENCKGKWRIDWFRGFYDPKFNDFELNEISGIDELYFAFQDERDYFLFKLRW